MNFQIEFTNHCNLKCVECPHHMMERKKEFMNHSTFMEILYYIMEFKPLTVIMHKDGEPLMHPHLFEYMKEIDDRLRVKFDIYTNGHLLTPEVVKEFAGLQSKVWILLSYHFFDYEGNYINHSHVDDTLLQCLSDCPDNVEFVLVTHLTDFMSEEAARVWQDAWKSHQTQFPHLRDVHVNPHINPWTGLIEQKNTITFDTCPYGDGEHMFFGVTGNVIACCMDLEEEVVFGNVMTDTKSHIMEQRDAFYKSHRENKVPAEVCRRCLS